MLKNGLPEPLIKLLLEMNTFFFYKHIFKHTFSAVIIDEFKLYLILYMSCLQLYLLL